MDLLLYENAYARIAARLVKHAPQVRAIVMQDDGGLIRDGAPIARDQAKPEIAWASTDLFAGGPARDFMILLLKSSTVSWLQTGSAGVDDPVFGKLAAKGIRLTNSNATAIAISEFILAGVLDVFQPNAERRANQAAKVWHWHGFREICDTTWAIVGLGNIGRETAIRAAAFGAKVIGVRRRPTGEEPVAEMVGPEDLPLILPQADVVVLSLALNRQSSRMVDREFLSAMKPGSILVNIARGGLIDEGALLAALDRGTPEFAILDVFDTEPLPAESPLWHHRRVRASSHCAAFGSGTEARGDRVFLENLDRYLAGRPLKFVVREAGI